MEADSGEETRRRCSNNDVKVVNVTSTGQKFKIFELFDLVLETLEISLGNLLGNLGNFLGSLGSLLGSLAFWKKQVRIRLSVASWKEALSGFWLAALYFDDCRLSL